LARALGGTILPRMPIVEVPCVFALLFLWCWTCVEVAVRAGRGPYWGALGLFCNPLIVLVFALPAPEGDPALPPQANRLRAAFVLSLIQLVLMTGIAAWVFSRS
jgi:hypothetical protein